MQKGKHEANLDGLLAHIIEHRLSAEELSNKFPNGYKKLSQEINKHLRIILKTFIVDDIMSMSMLQEAMMEPF